MRRGASVVLASVAIAASTVLALPAHAAQPTGGCGEGFELRTVKSLQREARNTPDEVFTDADTNGDGYICNRYLPPGGGTIHDNTTPLI
jgi:hypothetical protein